jgi:hypothetical protein
LEVIEGGVFQFAGLKTIEIPRSVKILCDHRFHNCSSLVSVTFKSGSRFEEIPQFAFSFTKLKMIVIPAPVKVVGSSAFAGCNQLQSVTSEVGSQLQKVGSGVPAKKICPIFPHIVKSESQSQFKKIVLVSKQ